MQSHIQVVGVHIRWRAHYFLDQSGGFKVFCFFFWFIIIFIIFDFVLWFNTFGTNMLRGADGRT